MYNINIREESFGATVSVVETGKREHITKEELEQILENKKFPNDMLASKIKEEYSIKFIPLEEERKNNNHFSFADIVYLELTRECNLRCKHCLNASGSIMPNQLSDEEFEKLINNLAKAGIQEIRLTGGEPLRYKNIYRLIKLATDNGVCTSIGTNATLVTKDVAHKLKEAGLKKAVVSLDGTEEKHNDIRGKGSYAKSIEGLKHMKDEGLDVRVNAVIMKSNIEDVIDLAKEMHKNKITLFIRRFIESGRGENLKDNMLSGADYKYVKEKLRKELEEGLYINGHYLRIDEGIHPRIQLPFSIIGCKAGQRAIAIMPDGDIQLCGFLAAQNYPAINNVRHIENWRTFWDELQKLDKLKNLREKIDEYNSIPEIQETYCLAYIQRYLNTKNSLEEKVKL